MFSKIIDALVGGFILAIIIVILLPIAIIVCLFLLLAYVVLKILEILYDAYKIIRYFNILVILKELEKNGIIIDLKSLKNYYEGNPKNE